MDSTFNALASQKKDLRRVFIENYGVNMELPRFYYHSAKFVPQSKDLIVILGWHIVPLTASTTIFEKKMNHSESNIKGYNDLIKMNGKNMILSLYRQDTQRGLTSLKHI